MNNYFSGVERTSTAGGIIFALIMQANAVSILQSALLAAVGAAASFIMSKCCNYIYKKYFSS